MRALRALPCLCWALAPVWIACMAHASSCLLVFLTCLARLLRAGTEMCNDPTRQVITVLFTNRCYPNQTKGLDTIRYVRQNFNNAVGCRVQLIVPCKQGFGF